MIRDVFLVRLAVAFGARRNDNRELGDTPTFEKLRQNDGVDRAPMRRAGRRDLKLVLLTFACSSVSGVGIYYLATYVNNHLTTVLGLDRTTGLGLSGAGLLLHLLMCPVVGALSDHFGRRSLNSIGTLGYVLLSAPAFALVSSRGAVAIVLGLVLLGACQAMCSVTHVVLLVGLFLPDTRSTGSAFGYDLGLLVAGPGPLVAAGLVNATGTPVAPAWYLVVVSLLAAPVDPVAAGEVRAGHHHKLREIPVEYEVIIVRYGTRCTRRSEVFLNYHLYGTPDDAFIVDYFFWVLRGQDRTMVFTAIV